MQKSIRLVADGKRHRLIGAALLVAVFWSISEETLASRSSTPVASANHDTPLIVYGDKNLPPYEFLEDGEPRGANIDLWKVISRELNRPLIVRLTQWSAAQEKVNQGEGHALTLMSINAERMKLYDFTSKTLPITFSLFVHATDPRSSNIHNYSKSRIGVTAGGYPRTWVKKNMPEVKLILIENHLDGYKKLLNKEIDAAGLVTWTGYYVLDEAGIGSVTAISPPFAKKDVGIPIPKGNSKLVEQINQALTKIKASGEYDKIINQWSGDNIILLKHREWTWYLTTLSIILFLFITSLFLFFRARTKSRLLQSEILEHKKSDQELKQREKELLQAQRIAKLGSWELEHETQKMTWSTEVFTIFGLDRKNEKPSIDALLNCAHPDDLQATTNHYLELSKNLRKFDFEHRIIRQSDGEVRIIRETSDHQLHSAIGETKSLGIIQDISDQRTLEKQVRWSQKMDAVGQLTGGIAHDFNNILGIIIGNLNLLESQIPADEKLQKRTKNIKKAADRAVKLTKQLLGFSRRQPTQTSLLNINKVIKGMDNLISRSITPQVEVDFKLSDELWLTEIDSGDFEDALLNLILNARDAMPEGGRLVIGSKNCNIDAAYCAQNPGMTPGEYIQLAVSDTGEGISLKQQEHIFEPFFTTKARGKGTGLGLAMVFGFVKRSRGYVKVYSEINIGTTFKLYIPQGKGTEQPVDLNAESFKALPTGTETILVVDDEEELLMVARECLETLGYRVISAIDGNQALDCIGKEHSISMLFSDVVMPGGINGYELAEQATAIRPDLKVLLTSGYLGEITIHRNQACFNDHFLSKPYSQQELAQRVGSILGKTFTEIRWTKGMSIGIDAIDNDHRKLIMLLNRCNKMQHDGYSQVEVSTIITELIDYAETHFQREEAIMKACGCPESEIHIKEHELFLTQVQEQQSRLQGGVLTIEALLEFLTHWVKGHVIGGMDQAIATHCQGKDLLIEQALKLDNSNTQLD